LTVFTYFEIHSPADCFSSCIHRVNYGFHERFPPWNCSLTQAEHIVDLLPNSMYCAIEFGDTFVFRAEALTSQSFYVPVPEPYGHARQQTFHIADQ